MTIKIGQLAVLTEKLLGEVEDEIAEWSKDSPRKAVHDALLTLGARFLGIMVAHVATREPKQAPQSMPELTREAILFARISGGDELLRAVGQLTAQTAAELIRQGHLNVLHAARVATGEMKAAMDAAEAKEKP